MTYPPLPEWEQVRKPKKMAEWWDNFESTIIDFGEEEGHKTTNKYANLKGPEAILRCLQEAKTPLRFRRIVNLLDRQETSVAGWLRRLLETGKITYEDHSDNVRYWRLLRPGETPRSLDSVRYGPIQRQLIAVLKPNPGRWFSPQELQQLLGLSRIGKVTQSLQSLVRTGDIEAQRNPDHRHGFPYRHPYRYRWPAAEAVVSG